ncbi:hypothetical protein [Streptomyces sp. WAC01280]|uniref:hypothetical protein n=1 Tax=Streptomyces sp. WAC01280 TaxID=2487424 RepID=UPI00163CD09D|nr:hypothetical protein [Streptomyces sp. WAC01280]
MAERLTFILEGRDNLSRVLGHAGNSADRLRRTMEDAADGSGQALLHLTQDADGRLRDLEGRFVSTADAAALMAHRTGQGARPMANWADAADQARAAGAELRKSFLGLAPAVIPAATALAPVAAAAGLGAVAIGAYGLAVGKQVGAISEAVKAEEKHRAAVEESGASSVEAVKAQMAYARQMAALPPATRQAAAALSVLKDTTQEWSDSLAGDTMAPITKGFSLLNEIVPRLTPTVRGAASELDRFMTIAGGAVASPGFNEFTARLDKATTGALHRANDALIRLIRTSDTSQVGAGVSEFLDFARAQGPAVANTMKNIATALVNVLNGASDVGVSMLSLVNTLSELVAAVPPGAIANLIQLAIAIKAVRLAALGLAAGRTAMLAFTGQIVAMQTAAAGSTTRMGALTAAFGTMSRGAKLALAGSGIGLLVIALSELSAGSRNAPPDVDKLTLSLKQLGSTGKATGEAAKAFGSDLGGLYDKVRSLTDPSAVDSVQQWIVTLGGLGNWDSTPVKEGKENLEAIDQALASLVSGGKPDLAAAAAKRLAAEYAKGGHSAEEFTSQLDGYQASLEDARLEQELAAQAAGLYGLQAQTVKAKLDAQKQSTDALRMALFELTNVNRDAAGAMSDFEAAIDNVAKVTGDHRGSLKMVNGELDLNSEKARQADAALRDLAAKAEAAAAAADLQGKSNEHVNGILDRGRQQLINHARELMGDKAAADALARSYLAVPSPTARLKGNIEDLQAKLNSAKKQLSSVPDARKAQVRANIAQLEGQLAEARRKLNAIDGTVANASVMVTYRQQNSGASDFTKSIGGYAGGGTPRAGEWAWVGEEGPELVQFKGSGARVYDHRTSMGMAGQVGAGQDVGAGLIAGMLGSRSGVEQAARGMAAGVEAGIRAELQIASPSKKTKKLMGHVSDGMAQGMATAGAKLRTQTKALMKDLQDGIVRGLTGSKSQIKATAVDLVKDIWAAWAGTKSTKDSELVRMVNRDHAKLQELASKRDSLRARITGARAALKARIEEQANYRAGVKATAQGASSLSSLGLEQAQVTTGTIRAGLAQKLVKLRQFNRYITMLTKRGLNKNLLRQLLAMGPEEGFAYASALAGMTNADFKSVNATQSQIDRESDSLGRHGAKTLYDAGVNSAQGLLKGLQSQEKAIEAQMLKMAQLMEKSIKQALGIKSPSRVGIGIGGNFGRSLGDGTLAELPYVGRAVDTVAGRMAAMRPMPGRPATGLGVTGQALAAAPVTINIHGATDPARVGQEVQRVLLRLKRINGGGSLDFS